jgi:hypothetical protein
VPSLRATPKWVGAARNPAVKITGDLKPIVAVVVTVDNSTGDLAPHSDPPRSAPQSERVCKTGGVAIREIEADQNHPLATGEPTQGGGDFGKCATARCGALWRRDAKAFAGSFQ